MPNTPKEQVLKSDIFILNILPLCVNDGNAKKLMRIALACKAWLTPCLTIFETSRFYQTVDLNLTDVHGCAWSPCGRFVVFSTTNSVITYTGYGKHVRTCKDGALPIHNTTGKGVAFSSDGTRIVTFGIATFTLWDANGNVVFERPHDPRVHYSLADFGVPGSPSDGLLAIAMAGVGKTELWRVDGDNSRIIATLEQDSEGDIVDETWNFDTCKFSVDGTMLVTSFIGSVCVYDTSTTPPSKVSEFTPFDNDSNASALCLSDGCILVSEVNWYYMINRFRAQCVPPLVPRPALVFTHAGIVAQCPHDDASDLCYVVSEFANNVVVVHERRITNSSASVQRVARIPFSGATRLTRFIIHVSPDRRAIALMSYEPSVTMIVLADWKVT